jgi:hypothetical protein
MGGNIRFERIQEAILLFFQRWKRKRVRAYPAKDPRKRTRRELKEETRTLLRKPWRVLSPSASPKTTCQAYVEGLNCAKGKKAVVYCSPGDLKEVIMPQKKGKIVQMEKPTRTTQAKTMNPPILFFAILYLLAKSLEEEIGHHEDDDEENPGQCTGIPQVKVLEPYGVGVIGERLGTRSWPSTGYTENEFKELESIDGPQEHKRHHDGEKEGKGDEPEGLGSRSTVNLGSIVERDRQRLHSSKKPKKHEGCPFPDVHSHKYKGCEFGVGEPADHVKTQGVQNLYDYSCIRIEKHAPHKSHTYWRSSHGKKKENPEKIPETNTFAKDISQKQSQCQLHTDHNGHVEYGEAKAVPETGIPKENVEEIPETHEDPRSCCGGFPALEAQGERPHEREDCHGHKIEESG